MTHLQKLGPSLAFLDLLHPTAKSIELRPILDTLTIGFASGAPPSAFDQHREKSLLTDSSWNADRFVKQIFLPELIRSALCIKIDNQEFRPNSTILARLLSQPPKDPVVLKYRQDILRALSSNDELRKDLERTYLAIQELRCQFESGLASRWDDGIRRKLSILSAALSCFDSLADGFGSVPSELSSLRELGTLIRTTDEYRRLTQLLDYENEMASVDLRLRLGSDGRVRELFPIEIRENSTSWYHLSPIGRLLLRLNMLLRGFRFGEDEIVARHLTGVFDGIDTFVVAILHLQHGIEFYLAALALKDKAAETSLEVCLPTFIEIGSSDEREFCGLFNPLLLGVVPKVVPCDLVTEKATCTVIVTGPNSGGKTRLLEAVALAQMLGQSGFFVPAKHARILPSHGLFVSLIEQAKADQTEGRLGTELVRIRELFEAMRVGDMVILDELCSGTNPSEGEEIFRLVVSLLAELRPQAFISTHFLQLASRLQSDMPVEDLQFRQVDLDDRQWPTYRFVPGVATSSLAHITAARLGVTREELQHLVERSKSAAF